MLQITSWFLVGSLSVALAADPPAPRETWTPLPPPVPETPVPTPEGVQGAFSIDLTAASSDLAGVRLVNAWLNRISQGKQLMAVGAKDAQNHIVSLDFRAILNDEQRKAMITLMPAPGLPIPVGALVESLSGPVAAQLDGVATKADMERICEFSEANDLPARPQPKAVGLVENLVEIKENKFVGRRIRMGKLSTGVGPVLEQWILTGPNNSMREYFFAPDGRRLVVAPPPEKPSDGPRSFIDRHLRELLKRRAPKPEIKLWDKFNDLARRADQGSNSAVDDEMKKFAAFWAKKKLEVTPTPTPTVTATGSPATATAPETTPTVAAP